MSMLGPSDPHEGRPPDCPLQPDAPDQPRVDHGPDQPRVDHGPDQPQVDHGPDQPQVDRGPDQPRVDHGPDQPQVDHLLEPMEQNHALETASTPAPSPLATRIVAWIHGPSGSRVPFTWGVAEASFFVIIPDVMIGLVALWGFRRGLKAAGWAVLGALVGGTLVYMAPTMWQSLFPHLPLISNSIMAEAHTRFAAHGWSAMVLGPVAGIPYKLYAAEAAGTNIAAFWFWTIVARAWRFIMVAIIAATIGWFGRTIRDRWPLPTLAVYAAFWVVVYWRVSVFVQATYP